MRVRFDLFDDPQFRTIPNKHKAHCLCVLICLLKFVNNKTLQCYPRKATISSMTGLSYTTIYRATIWLIRAKIVSKKRLPSTLLYTINPKYIVGYRESGHIDRKSVPTDRSDRSGRSLLIERIINPLAQKQGSWKGVVQSISNGINLESFGINSIKDPNKFIWSSAVDRGLVYLLDNWHKVKEIMPEATLDIYYPKYSDPHGNGEGDSWINIDGVVDKMEYLKNQGVTDMGSVSKTDLYAAMSKASYWMYLTDYEETFCITALEMQMSNVLCITSDNAALKNTVKSGIIIPTSNYETMFNQAVEILSKLKDHPALKQKALEEAKDDAKKYTWDMAAAQWHEAILNAEEVKKIKYEN